MKKRKEEILRNKEQSLQSSVQQPVQSTVQQLVQSTVQQPVQSTVQSNGTYFYGFGILIILAISVCVFFAYNSFPKNKKQANEKKRSTTRAMSCALQKSLK